MNNPETDHFRATQPKILVLGATGGTGRLIVAQALARGYDVTVLVRSPEKTSDLFDWSNPRRCPGRWTDCRQHGLFDHVLGAGDADDRPALKVDGNLSISRRIATSAGRSASSFCSSGAAWAASRSSMA